MSESNTNRERIAYISLTSESMEEFIHKYTTQAELIQCYMDDIRNGKCLNNEKIAKIEQFNNERKMKIIREYMNEN